METLEEDGVEGIVEYSDDDIWYHIRSTFELSDDSENKTEREVAFSYLGINLQ